tara:strand:+ start:317 stop:811 length:495 start_codon:yes stop_codon:yes gene_type:complete
MDPLIPLYELFDEMRVQPKPEMQTAGSPVESPIQQDGDYEHPVITQRDTVDKLRIQGAEPEDAHQEVYGEIDTGDVDSKAQYASTLGRLRADQDKKGIRVDKDGESLLAKERELEKRVTDEKLKTPINKEIDSVEVSAPPQELNAFEEFDYNEDVRYLQKYGRA